MKPRLSKIRSRGSKCYVLGSTLARQKPHAKGIEGILIGYNDRITGYRIWLPDQHKVVRSSDVIFEKKLPLVIRSTVTASNAPQSESPDVRSESGATKGLTAAPTGSTAATPSQTAMSLRRTDTPSQTTAREEESDNEATAVTEPPTEPDRSSLRPRSNLKKPKRFEALLTEAPSTVQEALASGEATQWKKAMDAEMKSFADNDV